MLFQMLIIPQILLAAPHKLCGLHSPQLPGLNATRMIPYMPSFSST